MTEPHVFGIDTNSYGFHMASNLTSPQLVILPTGETAEIPTKWSWYQAPKHEDVQQRRAAVFRAALSAFTNLPTGAAVFVEEPLVLTTNVNTTRALCMIAGVLEAAFYTARPDASWFWTPISSWRKAILGRGSGTKADMKAMAMDVARRQWHPSEYDQMATLFEQQPDLADATCIMLYGVDQLTTGKRKVT